MKRSRLLPVLLVAMMASCSKGGLLEAPRDQPLPSQFTMMKTTDDFQFRLQMYDLLSPDEKYLLWRDHLLKAKTQFTISSEYGKVSLIDELLSKISKSLFGDGLQASSTLDIFLGYFVPLWNKKAKAIFTELELYDLTYDPTVKVIGERPAPIEIGNTPGGNVPDCFCHVGTSGYACRRISVGIPSGITIVNGICENSTNANCQYHRRGCGFLWLYSCNGNHCSF